MSEHFYTSIAKYYQQIFPFSPAQISFLKQVLPYNGAKVLDVGCATGELSFALTRFGFPIWAFDFDAEMIEMAQNTKEEDTMFPVFEQLDMRLIEEHYPKSFFNTIICFGNTLVHLLTDDDILKFAKGAYKLLSPEGKLTIQILNYQFILDDQIKSLPLIDNEHISFERNYAFDGDSDLIDFNTKLTVKSTGQEIANSVKLYAIRQNKLQELLEEAGFGSFEYFGSFKAEPLTKTSLPLIVTCQKQNK
ncbi:MAG: class I SAM-dependent methyltransferase [Bacteroidota bacterium]|nr:class I SAM-dependent methyltransferase [Bacteroidota bacterium]